MTKEVEKPYFLVLVSTILFPTIFSDMIALLSISYYVLCFMLIYTLGHSFNTISYHHF